MKKTKKIAAAFLALCFCFCCTAYAAPEIQTRASNGGHIAYYTYTFEPNLKTGKIIYSASMVTEAGATNAFASTVIQRKVNGSWVNVPGTFFARIESGESVLVGSTKYVEKGYWYRTQSKFIAYRNGTSTTVVQNSGTTYYG